MKPEMPVQGSGFEKPLLGSERTLDANSNNGLSEMFPDSGAEKFEKRSEANAIMSELNLATALPTPVSAPTDDASVVVIGDAPVIANDDDLIEKEWVDRAKKIVAETRDNPHKRDEEVNKLQADYIKKRYGRELGAAT